MISVFEMKTVYGQRHRVPEGGAHHAVPVAAIVGEAHHFPSVALQRCRAPALVLALA